MFVCADGTIAGTVGSTTASGGAPHTAAACKSVRYPHQTYGRCCSKANVGDDEVADGAQGWYSGC